MTPSASRPRIFFATYPFAFFTPGGGEVQLLKYAEYAEYEGLDANFFDPWHPKLQAGDCLHFFSCMSGSIHFLESAKRLGVRVLVSPNLWVEPDEVDKYPYAEIAQILGGAHTIVCNSSSECELLSSVFRLPIEKFTVVYNAVDEHFLSPIDPDIFRKHYGINDKFVLNVANVEIRKNQLKLAEAIREFPEYKLVVIGGVRDNQYYEACRSLCPSQWIHIPYIEHSSILLRSAYAACAAFALPSIVETPGLAALEAVAAGAKTIVTQRGSASEYFGNTVHYIDHDSIESILAALHATLEDELFSPIPQQELIKSKFTWKHTVKDLAKIYNNK